MHVGLIGGIGPAVTFLYYQRLFEIALAKKFALELTVVNCDMPQFLNNFSQDKKENQASIFAELTKLNLIMAKKVKTTELKVDKSMMLITSNWGPYKSFKAIPVTDACPYMEAIFDPSSKILAVISKHSKQSYHMLPKLDDNGDPMKLKISKRENGKDYREERRLIERIKIYFS